VLDVSLERVPATFLLMGMVMITAMAVIFGNLLADVINALIDPRIRLE
jgi:ABC-type dipeptide/oligopeptide/nickel transport system permease component